MCLLGVFLTARSYLKDNCLVKPRQSGPVAYMQRDNSEMPLHVQCSFLAGFLENEMEGIVEIVKPEKYPETPLPREMIDMEVQNMGQAKKEGRGHASGCLGNMLDADPPARKVLITETSRELPACRSAPQLTASAVRSRLALLHVANGAQSFHYPL